MIKKIILVMSVFSLLVFGTTSIGAYSEDGVEEVSETNFSLNEYYLIERFKSEGQLNDYEIENLVSISSKVVDVQNAQNSNARGAISSSKLRIDIAAIKLGYRDMYLKTTFTWLSRPALFLNYDAVAFSWANNFSFISYNATRTYAGGTQSISSTLPMMNPAPNAGVGFQVDPRNHVGNSTTLIYSVSVNITLRNETIHSSTNFAAQYAHKTLGFGQIGVGFDSTGPSISWSLPAGTYDVGAAMIAFSNR